LLEPVLVAAHRRERVRELFADADLGPFQLVLDQGEHVEQDLVDVERLHLQASRAREIQEAVDDLGGAEGLLLDLLEEAGLGIARLDLRP
jgi:hypothetical protein